MEKQKERRAYPRFKCGAPVDILGGKPLRFFSAWVHNFSVRGLCVELPAPLQAGEMIVARIEDNAVLDPVSFGTSEQRRAEVRWCLETVAENERRYVCGAQYM